MSRYLEIVRAAASSLDTTDVAVCPPGEQQRTASRRSPTGDRTVFIGPEEFSFFIWSGESLDGGTIALDTETRPIEGHDIPELALASASDGRVHCIVPAERFPAFLEAHGHRDFVCHNAAFDFWVVDRHLRQHGLTEALQAWWTAADEGRLHDTMLLDMLIQLARQDAYPVPRDLGLVANQYASLTVDKSDPYRLRYGEIVGKDIQSVDPGFLRYAVKDAIVTHRAYGAMVQQARILLDPFSSELLPDAVDRFGLLTESLQVRAAIALAAITRHGMHIDGAKVEAVAERLRAEMASQVQQLQAMPASSGLFKTDRHGAPRLTPRGGAPCMSKKKLEELLTQIASRADEEIAIKRTPKGAVCTSARHWAQYAGADPFIGCWVGLTETAKLCQFFGNLQADIVHPRYTVLVRTGRTSCSNPNIQQLPRKGGFREMVVASPGHYLLAIDYSFIELRTLAAVCESRYGTSKLAQVIRSGVDPHAHTAAMFAGLSQEEFASLKETAPNQFATLRQRAKALNFGIPGGLGPASLVAYAKSTYGVELTLEEAGEFRRQLIEEVYPELTPYLTEDAWSILAWNLGTTTEICRQAFPSRGALLSARRIVSGRNTKANGDEYKPRWIDQIWNSLEALCQKTDVHDSLASRRGSEQLMKRLFWGPVVTLTGRVRGRASFSQSRNTPFQGLAADGAKLAIWALIKAGYRVIGFIHDEVLIEVPVDGGHTKEAARIERIMVDSMEMVSGNVPVACEYALAYRWYKQAEAVFQDRMLVPWEPEDSDGTTKTTTG